MTTPTTNQPSQVPASWQYSLVNGVSTATYNGAVVAAGSIAFTNLTITGTLTVDGATVLDGAVTINNNLSVTTPGGNIFDVTNGGVTVDTSATNTAITINSGTNTTTVEGGTVIIDGTTNVTVETGPGGNINLNPGAGGNVNLGGNPLTVIQPVINPSITIVTLNTVGVVGPNLSLGDALAHGATIDTGSEHTTPAGGGPGTLTATATVSTAGPNRVLIVTVHTGTWSLSAAAPPSSVTVTAPGLTFVQRGHTSGIMQSNSVSDVYTFWAACPAQLTNVVVTASGLFNAQQNGCVLSIATQAFSGISLTSPWDSLSSPVSNLSTAAAPSTSFSIVSNSNAVLFFASTGQNVSVPTGPAGWVTLLNGGTGTGNAFGALNTSYNLTPSGAGANTGFINLGGLILQWGQIPSTASGATATVIFPIPFPNACMNVVLCDDSGPGNNALGTFDVAHGSITKNQFQAYLNDFTTSPTPNMTGFWQAIGN